MEKIFNIFLYYVNDVCSEVGYVAHDLEGSDQQGLHLLQSSIKSDLACAKKIRLNKSFTRSQLNAKARLGEAHHLYDQLFVELNAGINPLFISTPVLNEELVFNYTHGDPSVPLNIKDVSKKLGDLGMMDDWLVKYTNDDGIDLSRLIHDDYFKAIKLLFQAGLYVSAMKLLMSCIDSIAYIEFGNVRGAFAKWLNEYADLSSLGIKAEELWELRNGLLHMTNLEASKVASNAVRRISFYVAQPVENLNLQSEAVYYFKFKDLIDAFAIAQGRWIESYNRDREKFATFVERYDQTLSDVRTANLHVAKIKPE